MIRLLQNEAEILVKKVPNVQFAKASISKNKGGKTYYLNDDSTFMYVLADMRGYKDKAIVVRGKDSVYSAVQQCVDENIYM